MTFLPIAERELRVASRRRGTWRVRFWSALLALLASGWVYLLVVQPSARPSELGQSLFQALSWLAFVYCVAVGIRVTSDCLSEEKREGTLGLLFLTDLRGYDVVFGKLVATSMNSLYGLLAILPVLALPLLLGGVDPQAVWQTAAALLDTLFLSLAMGMLVSALCRNERKAMLGTLLLLFVLTVGLPVGRVVLDEGFNHRPPLGPDPLLLASPAYLFGQATVSLGSFAPNHTENFVVSAVTIQALAWGFLALASLVLPRTWHEKPSGAIAVRWRERWQLWTQGVEALRRATRRYLLEVNPFLWLAGRDRFKTDLVWACLGGVGVAWFWGWVAMDQDWLSLEIGFGTAIVLHTLLKCWLASEACRRFVEDRRGGTLEVLLSTPLEVEEILRGQLLALRRQFGGPILTVVMVDLLLMVVALKHGGNVTSSDRREELTLWLGEMFIFLSDAYTLAWVGMWQGLNARSLNRATVGTLVRVLGVRWGLFLAVVTAVGLFDLGPRLTWSTQATVGSVVLWWTLMNAGFWAWARLRLQSGFRVVATLRFQPQRARGRRWPFRRAEWPAAANE